MDLGLLSEKLKKDAVTYNKEYEIELDTLESIIGLPQINVRQLRPLLAFVIRNGHINKERTWNLLKETLAHVKDLKIRRSILGGAIVYRQKRMISSTELFRTILLYGSDLKMYFKGCREFVDNNCYDVLCEWYYKGMEKQKAFCYYFLLILFLKNNKLEERMERKKSEVSNNVVNETVNNYGKESTKEGNSNKVGSVVNETVNNSDKDLTKEGNSNKKREEEVNCIKNELLSSERRDDLEKIICEAFFGSSKLTKICLLYFLNRIEIACDLSKIKNGYEYGKRIYFELTQTMMERVMKIKKAEVYVLFKKEFQIKNSITKMLMNMVDVEKEDLGEILNCLIKSVEQHEVLDVVKMISEEFVNEGKEDDIACYGMNVLRELYIRFAGLYKETVSEEEDSHLVEEEDSHSVEEEDSHLFEEEDSDLVEEDYTNKKKIKKTNKLEEDETSKTKRIYNRNCMDIKEPDSEFIKKLKDVILGYISVFSGNHNKSIHFAYKSVIKAVVHGEITDKDATFIMKSKTKEERKKLRIQNKEERDRNRANEQYQQRLKRNRKGKVNKRKNRLFVVKKKTGRS